MIQFIPVFNGETFSLTKTHYHPRDNLIYLYLNYFFITENFILWTFLTGVSHILLALKGY